MAQLDFQTRFESSPAQTIQPNAFAYLNYLRFVSMGCRSKRQTNLFEACALLHVEKDASLEAHAEALMRCLNEALCARAYLYAPGSQEMTFDEKWLVQLGLATGRKDELSTRFLLNSRVPFENRRLVKFLVSQISECFSLN